MRIGIDIDDTICKTYPVFLDYFNQRNGTSLKFSDFKEFLPQNWIKGFEKSFVLDELTEFFKEKISFFETIEHCVEIISKLKEEGHELLIITSRWKDYEQESLDWLDKHFGLNIFEEVLFTFMFEKDCKSIPCNQFNVDLMIEDCPYHAKSIKEKAKANVLMPRQPYNEIVENCDRIQHCDCWNEIYLKIQEKN